MVALRKELKAVEAQQGDAEELMAAQTAARRRELQHAQEDWARRVEEAELRAEQAMAELRGDKDSVRAACSNERQRINDKVAAVVAKKSVAVAELTKMLSDLRRKNAQLQEDLDTGRQRKLAKDS